MPPAIKTVNLKKYYRSTIRGVAFVATDGVNLEVAEGEVFALAGPNGAGKTTLIKIILGLLRQNSGTCEIFGRPARACDKSQIGYLPEAPYFYKFMTGLELVSFFARLCGLNRTDATRAAQAALKLVGLSDAADKTLAQYSKGMVQRAGLAQAIVHNPRLVVLDEPASGLDPVGAADMADIVRKLKGDGKTVLLCSHMMGEVEKLADRVAILSKGKIAACGTLAGLLETSASNTVEFETSDAAKLAKIREFAKSLGVESSAPAAKRIPLDEFFKRTVDKK